MSMLVEGAINLGVIPAVSLFLIWNMHQQNQRLTQMLDRREREMADMLDKRDREMSKWLELVLGSVLPSGPKKEEGDQL